MKCARCGHDMDIHEYVQNSRMFKILRVDIVLHFCKNCIELIKERRVEE